MIDQKDFGRMWQRAKEIFARHTRTDLVFEMERFKPNEYQE